MTAITIRDFMGAAEHGRVSIANFLAGFLELMKQLQLFPPNPIPVEGEEEQNTLPRNSQLQTASDCFSRLVLGIITFQIRSDAVLHTKFMCEMKETENDTRNDLQSCLLYRGVSALYRALHKPDRGRFKEIQVHSDIWFAVHFSCRSPSRDSELNPVLLESAHTGVSDNDNTVAWDFLEKLPKLSNRESSQVPHNLTDFLSLGTGAHEYVKLASDPGPYNPIFAWNIVLHWILHGFPASSGVHLIMHPANLHIAQILTEWWSGKIDDVSIPMQFFKDLEIAIFHGRIVGLLETTRMI
ncbi:uncharacterized protein LY89DRAFT_723486 [Mollisia scopiformis]|uniref:Uncharacterized protein n=1 Tax=Mollisia scopiformis TaxID=149040 RepID=A0A132BDZ5_MOLSC|nr:uncharacterized protein LY89DRAFT_723486 [Mollisia scopiformis]KUJ10219.1 hypothetical protein LY89DRAFT_723486 [Mollisia scopiformis]